MRTVFLWSTGATEYSCFMSLMKQLVPPLTIQLSDRRSSIVKQVTDLSIWHRIRFKITDATRSSQSQHSCFCRGFVKAFICLFNLLRRYLTVVQATIAPSLQKHDLVVRAGFHWFRVCDCWWVAAYCRPEWESLKVVLTNLLIIRRGLCVARFVGTTLPYWPSSSHSMQACHLLNMISKELLQDFEPFAEAFIPVSICTFV